MKSEASPRLKDYLVQLKQGGRYFFTSQDASRETGASRDAVKLALNRMRHKGQIASPGRGLYVVVPPEYHALGSLPADQFIPSLMEQTKTPYYVGLLSAAQYHGSAHHRPHELQVMVSRPRRPIQCGTVRVGFHVRRRLADVPTQNINTPRGTIKVSTPDATALDLIGYEAQIGGLDAVATILAELAAKFHAEKLAALAPYVPMPWAQRLGYLLESVDEAPKAKSLKDYVRKHAHEAAALKPSQPVAGYPRETDWRLIVNADVKTDA